MDRRIVLHTGFMKTGSSYLQANVFPGLGEVRTYSYDHPFLPLAIGVRNAAPDADLSEQRKVMRDWVSASDLPVQLFSWEGLVGGYLADYQQFPAVTTFLKSTFPDAHILLCIRRQDALVDSLYRQSLHTYHFSGVAEFLNRGPEGFGPWREGARANIDVRSLAFGPVVDAYEAAFGADRVHVLPYELMRADPPEFYRRLSSALGAEVGIPAAVDTSNRSYSALSVRVARVLNRFYRTPHNPRGLIRPETLDLRALLQRGLDRLFYSKGEVIPAAWAREIMDLHAADNRALDKRRQIGLAALGYCP
jgi:hypothetical protein